MRPLKFRAWDRVNMKMYAIESIRWSGDFSIRGLALAEKMSSEGIDTLRFFNDGNQNNFDLMQFTGLKDKNGKEIYEGDILKHLDTFYPEENEPEHYSVEYVLEPFGGFCACRGGSPARLVARLFDDDGYETEVIGNIRENPELMNAAS